MSNEQDGIHDAAECRERFRERIERIKADLLALPASIKDDLAGKDVATICRILALRMDEIVKAGE